MEGLYSLYVGLTICGIQLVMEIFLDNQTNRDVLGMALLTLFANFGIKCLMIELENCKRVVDFLNFFFFLTAALAPYISFYGLWPSVLLLRALPIFCCFVLLLAYVDNTCCLFTYSRHKLTNTGRKASLLRIWLIYARFQSGALFRGVTTLNDAINTA